MVQVYGSYYRTLSKNVQEVLAEANIVAEEVLSSMTTVKAHAAEDAAAASYAERLQRFAHLQLKEAAAYSVYAFTTILMPNSVAVVALFYVRSVIIAACIVKKPPVTHRPQHSISEVQKRL